MATNDAETYPSEERASKLTFVWKTPEFQPLESGVIYLQLYRLFWDARYLGFRDYFGSMHIHMQILRL